MPQGVGDDPQDFVAHVMAVALVELFEVVDVDKDHGIAPVIAFVLVAAQLEGAFEHAPVGGPSERVGQCLPLDDLEAVGDGAEPGVVVEDFHRAHYHPFG